MSWIWKRTVSESLWGGRGLIKTIHLWLPLAVYSTTPAAVDGGHFTIFFALLAASVCFSQIAILANDLTDRASDAAVGKQRWITMLSHSQALVLLGLLSAIGVLALFFVQPCRLGIIPYAAALSLGLLYSLRPVRCKSRGIWGLLTYSASTTLAFAITPRCCLSGHWPTILLLALGVLLDKWVNLHLHQITDHDGDRQSNIRTFAVVVGLSEARRTLLAAARLSALTNLIIIIHLGGHAPPWGGIAVGVSGAAMLMIGIYLQVTSRRSPLTEELPWYYLASSWGTFRAAPPILLLSLIRQAPATWIAWGVCCFTILLEWRYLRLHR